MAGLASAVKALQARREALEAEIGKIDGALEALRDLGAPSGRGRGARKGRKGGKWRPGRPGRPPKWYVEQQKKAKAAKGAK